MLRLLLLRHAKSSWADSGMADRDRPLAPRGRRAAKRMAAVISGPDFMPGRVICSPARRTRETLAPLLPGLASPDAVTIADELYEAAAGHYREVIASYGGLADRLLVIGHNPAIQATALELIAPQDDGVADQLTANFPTGALAVIDFDIVDWAGIKARSGRLAQFLRPRDIEKG